MHYGKLIEIVFSYNKLNSISAKSLSSVLIFFNLQKINLSYNKIKYEGAKAIVEKLNETPFLQYIDLSNNNLFSEGKINLKKDYEFEKMLGKNLRLVKHLHTLKLQGCNLTSESIKIISENFIYNPNLELINFSCNKIDQNGKLIIT